MALYRLIVLITVAAAVVAPATASVINVKGLVLLDWTSAPAWTDPNEALIADHYDIKDNYFEAQQNPALQNRWFFRLDMYGTTNTWGETIASGPDYAVLVFDTDNNQGTGGAVVGGTWDAYAYWDLTASNSSLFVWNGASFNAPVLQPVGGGTSINPPNIQNIEWEIDPALLGLTHGASTSTWNWGSFIEGGDTNPDDYSPDNLNEIPEPGTLALFGLGLMGAAVVIRRRKSA